MTAFVDSSAWYAAADRADASHDRIAEILAEAQPLLTSDHVLVESWLLLNSRIGRDVAERFLGHTVHGGLSVEIATTADLEKAIEIGRAFNDQSFSLVDRTSFAVMERLGVERVVSLDDDFAVYRYGPRRGRPFTVLR